MKYLALLILIFNYSLTVNATDASEMLTKPESLRNLSTFIRIPGQAWDWYCNEHTDSLNVHLSNHAYKHSLAIQFADLRLTDDIYGINGLFGKITHGRTIWNPFLYKLSKEDKKFHILGTEHTVPLSALPTFVKDTVFSCETLINERYPSRIEMSDLRKTMRDRYSNPNHTWYDDLSEEHQIVLGKIFLTNNENDRGADDKKFEIDIDIMPMIYNQLHFDFGMDTCIEDYFEENNKKIIGLDLSEENQDVYEIFAYRNITKKEKLNKLTECITCTQEYKGLLQYPSLLHSANMYLFSNTDYEIKSMEKNPLHSIFLAQTKKWWPRLIDLISDNNIKDSCVVVGLAHVLGEDGLLDLAAKDGWSITRLKAEEE